MNPKELQILILLEIIAPSNEALEKLPVLSEEVRNSIKAKWEQKLPWDDVFSDIEDEYTRNKYTELFNYLEEQSKES